jgi:hypothetical protein
MIGTRVEIPVGFDLWIRGARFGTIKRITPDGYWMVKMDNPQVRRLVCINHFDQNYTKIL